MDENVIGMSAAEFSKAWQASLQIATYLARTRANSLAAAKRSDERHARALQRIMESERRLAEPIYLRGLNASWIDRATPEDVAYTHGIADRFARLDPAAALASRTCGIHAKEHWGIDLNQNQGSLANRAQALQIAPILPGEENERPWETIASAAMTFTAYDPETRLEQEVTRDRANAILDHIEEHHADAETWLNDQWKDQLREWTGKDPQIDTTIERIYPGLTSQQQAQANHVEETLIIEKREAREALAATGGEVTPNVKAELNDIQVAGARWDSLQGRQAWEQRLGESGIEAPAARAATTADKANHQPLQGIVAANKNTTKVKKPKSNPMVKTVATRLAR